MACNVQPANRLEKKSLQQDTAKRSIQVHVCIASLLANHRLHQLSAAKLHPRLLGSLAGKGLHQRVHLAGESLEELPWSATHTNASTDACCASRRFENPGHLLNVNGLVPLHP